MTFQTAFNLGDRVRVTRLNCGKDLTKQFIVRQIQIKTLARGELILTEYRSSESSGGGNTWYAEKELAPV